MNLGTPIEYFYGDTLRWSFGFENPNKAAVLFACALPLIGWCWLAGWRIKNCWFKGLALAVAASAYLVTSYCLCMTFSRGGLVAAVVGLLYLMGREWWLNKKQTLVIWVIQGALLVALVCIVMWTGLGDRSAKVAGGDASVGNRVELWSGALQMSVENPLGFGAGQSGEQYMQWYQPVDRKVGYRTMVNSYLTFLVERGWLWSIAAVLGFVVIWTWTRAREAGQVATALRASVIAFLVAGIFSTTMEMWQLWILPISCGVILLGTCVWEKPGLEWGRVALGGVCLLGVCAILATIGIWKMAHDPLRREFSSMNHTRTVVGIGPKVKTARSLGCVVDQAVLGEEYSKLLRSLALSDTLNICLGDHSKSAERVMWVGHAVHLCRSYRPKNLILLFPEKIDDTELAAIVSVGSPVQLILPEIDEDGRVAFWEDAASGPSARCFEKTALSGVGNRIDWAWDQVADLLRTQANPKKATKEHK
jgi:hypothetical protein